jgi:hypothetical protein
MSTRRARAAKPVPQQNFPTHSEAPLQNFDAIVPQHADMFNQKPFPHAIHHNGMLSMAPNYPMYPPLGMEMQPGYPYNAMPTAFAPTANNNNNNNNNNNAPGQQRDVAANASASRQIRKAQVQAKNQLKTQAAKRKASVPAAPASQADSDGSDDSDDDGVPDGPSAADIAKHKYNHIEDEKERKKLKRLLRNRVSAQQARERKKAFLGKLEVKCNELESRAQELEHKVNKLERENFMLRQVVKNTTSKNPLNDGM